MKKSKFLGMVNGEYVCTAVIVVDVQPIYCRKRVDGVRVKSKSPYSRQYGYVFEKLTSDGKAMKSIWLSASQVRKVYKGQATVDEIVKRKERKRSQTLKEKVSYSFCD